MNENAQEAKKGSLGEFIRNKRNEVDISLRGLARELEISPPFLSDIELGRRYPSNVVLRRIAQHFRLPFGNLKKLDDRISAKDLKRVLQSNQKLRRMLNKAVLEMRENDALAKRPSPLS